MRNSMLQPSLPRPGTLRVLEGLAQQLGLEIISQHLQIDSAGESERAGKPSAQARIDQFEALFRRYEVAISGYLWRLTGNEEVAYDLCQETFLQAWRHFDTLLSHPYPNRWLFRVATRKAQHFLRHERTVGIIVPLDEDIAKTGDLATIKMPWISPLRPHQHICCPPISRQCQVSSPMKRNGRFIHLAIRL
jgi:hypothetical protein